MAIEKINIKNFTVFEDKEIEFSNGVNVFIGENGTGKTHLLKLIYGISKINDESKDILSFRKYFSNDIKQLKPMLVDLKYKDIDNETDKKYLMGALKLNINGQTSSLGTENECSIEISFPIIDPNIVFIPAKEMLSLSKIIKVNEKYKKELNMDKTLTDIIVKALNLKPDNIHEMAKTIVPILEKHIDGKIFVEEDDTFWVLKNNGDKIPFTMEAEGIRKLGLLWQLLMNENITKGTVLLWDEPEANLNPKLIPDLVEILLELSRNGVQIFLATHDYFLPNFIDVLKKEDDNVLFHALYKTEHGVQCESEKSFDMLENNSINKELITLYKEGVKKVMQ